MSVPFYPVIREMRSAVMPWLCFEHPTPETLGAFRIGVATCTPQGCAHRLGWLYCQYQDVDRVWLELAGWPD